MGILGDDQTVDLNGTTIRLRSRSGIIKGQYQLFAGDRLLDEGEIIHGSRELSGYL